MKNLNDEYKDLMKNEMPDLWDKISAELGDNRAGAPIPKRIQEYMEADAEREASAEIVIETENQNLTNGQKQVDFQALAGKQKQAEVQTLAGNQRQTESRTLTGSQKQAEVQTLAGNQRQTESRILAGSQKQAGDQTQSGKMTQVRTSTKKTLSYYVFRYGSLAAACICVVLLIPLYRAMNNGAGRLKESTVMQEAVSGMSEKTEDLQDAVFEMNEEADALQEASFSMSEESDTTNAFSDAGADYFESAEVPESAAGMPINGQVSFDAADEPEESMAYEDADVLAEEMQEEEKATITDSSLLKEIELERRTEFRKNKSGEMQCEAVVQKDYPRYGLSKGMIIDLICGKTEAEALKKAPKTGVYTLQEEKAEPKTDRKLYRIRTE